MNEKIILEQLDSGSVHVLKYYVVEINGKELEVQGTRWRGFYEKSESNLQLLTDILPTNLYESVRLAWGY